MTFEAYTGAKIDKIDCISIDVCKRDLQILGPILCWCTSRQSEPTEP